MKDTKQFAQFMTSWKMMPVFVLMVLLTSALTAAVWVTVIWAVASMVYGVSPVTWVEAFTAFLTVLFCYSLIKGWNNLKKFAADPEAAFQEKFRK